MQKHRNVTILVLILIVSTSCSSLTPTETPTPVTVTEPPAQTETTVPTLPVATSTPPAPTDTPVPPGLNATGPYVLYSNPKSIWISNPDGSFLTQLTDEGFTLNPYWDWRRSISPQGDRLALIVPHAEGLDLVEMKLPSGERKIITRLYSITEEELRADREGARTFTTYAIRYYDNVAWQPGGGSLLAFIGALDGPTPDLYVYDTESGEITRLTSDAALSILPSWSPDGKYILYYDAIWKAPLGSHNYDLLEGVRAVRVADGQVIALPKIPQWQFVGWQDESHYLIYDDGPLCTSENLRSVDVATGEATPIVDFMSFNSVARSPENGALLLSESTNCEDAVPGEGVFLLLPGQTTPMRLLDKKNSATVSWLPESKVFYVSSYALFSSDGSTRYDAPVYNHSYLPALSRKGYQAWDVIENFQGRIEVKVPEADWQTIYKGIINHLIWDPISGETLLFLTREGTLYSASYPDFTPREIGKTPYDINQVVWVP